MKSKKLKRLLIPIVGILVLAIAVSIFLGATNSPDELDLPPRDYYVEKGTITIGSKAQGVFSMDRYPESVAEKSIVKEYFVEKGDLVKKGDLICELDLERMEIAKRALSKEVSTGSLGISDSILNQLTNVSPERKMLASLNEQMKNPKIYASRDGVILSLPYEVGKEVGADQTVAEIGDMENGKLTLTVSSSELFTIETGNLVEFKTSLYPGDTFTGTISRVSYAPNDQGDFEIEAKCPAISKPMLDNLKVVATFVAVSKKDVLILSNKAITMKGTKQYVTVEDENGKRYQREVRTGLSDGKVSEILSGLTEGEKVVVEASNEN